MGNSEAQCTSEDSELSLTKIICDALKSAAKRHQAKIDKNQQLCNKANEVKMDKI